MTTSLIELSVHKWSLILTNKHDTIQNQLMCSFKILIYNFLHSSILTVDVFQRLRASEELRFVW